jgi:hypothetical protein
MVHKSRFGFHPCDYQTYKKLKILHREYQKAVSQRMKWIRWERKEPHNRVMRERIRNSQGQVVGYGIKVPMPEPEIDPLFCQKRKELVHWDKKGKYHKDGIFREVVDIEDHDICENYRRARYPFPTENVKPLTISLETIDRLYQPLM